MQRASHALYVYDAKGRLSSFCPSGSSVDVVTDHVYLDPRIPGPRSLVAGGLRPTVLNSSHLFTPPLSVSSPPVQRPVTIGSQLGYSNISPESKDIYSITRAKPILTMDRQVRNLADRSNVLSEDTSKHRGGRL